MAQLREQMQGELKATSPETPHRIDISKFLSRWATMHTLLARMEECLGRLNWSPGSRGAEQQAQADLLENVRVVQGILQDALQASKGHPQRLHKVFNDRDQIPKLKTLLMRLRVVQEPMFDDAVNTTLGYCDSIERFLREMDLDDNLDVSALDSSAGAVAGLEEDLSSPSVPKFDVARITIALGNDSCLPGADKASGLNTSPSAAGSQEVMPAAHQQRAWRRHSPGSHCRLLPSSARPLPQSVTIFLCKVSAWALAPTAWSLFFTTCASCALKKKCGEKCERVPT